MNYLSDIQHYLVPAENFSDWNKSADKFLAAVAVMVDINESENNAKNAILSYDDATADIADKLEEINCFTAVTDQFLFLLNLHDDCQELINVEPLHVH